MAEPARNYKTGRIDHWLSTDKRGIVRLNWLMRDWNPRESRAWHCSTPLGVPSGEAVSPLSGTAA